VFLRFVLASSQVQFECITAALYLFSNYELHSVEDLTQNRWQQKPLNHKCGNVLTPVQLSAQELGI